MTATESDPAGDSDLPAAATAESERQGSEGVSYVVNNHFHREFNSRRTQMGVAVSPHAPLTGFIKIREEAGSEAYVRPAAFAAAAARLRSARLVVLSGADGSGKRSGALRLLENAGAGRVLSISPALSLEEMARGRFDTGDGYLVQDWTPPVHSDGATGFSIKQLAAKLEEVGTHLVITTTEVAAVSMLADFAVTWHAPPVGDVIDAYTAHWQLEPSDRDRIRQHLSGVDRPRLVASFAAPGPPSSADDLEARLRVSHDEEVLRAFEAADHEWIVLVAALSFADGLRESLFEELLEGLQIRVRDALTLHGGANDDEASLLTLEPERDRRQTSPLVGRTGFAVDHYRRVVLQQLWRRYDRQLWRPLSEWATVLAGHQSHEVQLSAALGAALLAQEAREETRDSLLNVWASGSAEQNVTAAYALWWCSLDESLAAFALTTATSWAQRPEPAQRRSATLAFSGNLGLRFPADSLRWLWHLAVTEQGAPVGAARAVGVLFTEGVSQGDGGGYVLRFLEEKLARIRRQKRPLEHERLLLDIAAHVLQQRISSGSAVALLLMENPEEGGAVGALCCELISLAPWRGRGIEVLRRVGLTLRDHGRLDVLRQLGALLVARLSPDQIRLLERDLLHALKQRVQKNPATTDIVSDLLRTSDVLPESPPANPRGNDGDA